MRDLSTPPQQVSYDETYKYQIKELNKQLYDAYNTIERLQQELKRYKDGQN